MKALTDVGITTDRPVTKNLRGISLRSALQLLLRDLDLTYVVKSEYLLITTPEEANKTLVVKVYPVGDLVVPIPQDELNPFGWNSNLPNITAGGQGGGGGGGGGGGAGGGGGFGGGGGGGQGGGAFSVPDNAVTPGPIEGPAAFAVPDELKMSSKKNDPAKPASDPAKPAAANAKPEAAASTKAAPQGIPTQNPVVVQGKRIAAAAGGDREAAWDALFAGKVSDADIRETARQLMHEKNYEESIALIQSALRNGQGQSWMYEALGLSLELAGKPLTEVERALMSAVDFSRDTNELSISRSTWPVRERPEGRALKLFRQISATDPLRSEPYVYGMRLAERMGDVDSLEWACAALDRARPGPGKRAGNRQDRRADRHRPRSNSCGRGPRSEADEFQAELDEPACAIASSRLPGPATPT